MKFYLNTSIPFLLKTPEFVYLSIGDISKLRGVVLLKTIGEEIVGRLTLPPQKLTKLSMDELLASVGNNKQSNYRELVFDQTKFIEDDGVPYIEFDIAAYSIDINGQISLLSNTISVSGFPPKIIDNFDEDTNIRNYTPLVDFNFVLNYDKILGEFFLKEKLNLFRNLEIFVGDVIVDTVTSPKSPKIIKEYKLDSWIVKNIKAGVIANMLNGEKYLYAKDLAVPKIDMADTVKYAITPAKDRNTVNVEVMANIDKVKTCKIWSRKIKTFGVWELETSLNFNVLSIVNKQLNVENRYNYQYRLDVFDIFGNLVEVLVSKIINIKTKEYAEVVVNRPVAKQYIRVNKKEVASRADEKSDIRVDDRTINAEAVARTETIEGVDRKYVEIAVGVERAAKEDNEDITRLVEIEIVDSVTNKVIFSQISDVGRTQNVTIDTTRKELKDVVVVVRDPITREIKRTKTISTREEAKTKSKGTKSGITMGGISVNGFK